MLLLFETKKCAICASWAPFSIFSVNKSYMETRALLTDLKRELENYIGKLETTVEDSKIQFAVNFMFKKARRVGPESSSESVQRAGILPTAPTFFPRQKHML